jgi:hypothetical protein
MGILHGVGDGARADGHNGGERDERTRSVGTQHAVAWEVCPVNSRISEHYDVCTLKLHSLAQGSVAATSGHGLEFHDTHSVVGSATQTDPFTRRIVGEWMTNTSKRFSMSE